MESARRTTLSLALFILICFFLPWVQVSCLGAKDSVSGLELARDGVRALWLIPALTLVVLALGVFRGIVEQLPALFSLSGMVGGGVSAWLMIHQRGDTESSPHLIATFWTPWYWLGLMASFCLAFSALWFYIKRVRAP